MTPLQNSFYRATIQVPTQYNLAYEKRPPEQLYDIKKDSKLCKQCLQKYFLRSDKKGIKNETWYGV